MIRIDFGRILDNYTCLDYGGKITVICHLNAMVLLQSNAYKHAVCSKTEDHSRMHILL